MNNNLLSKNGYWNLVNKFSAGILLIDIDKNIVHWNSWFQNHTTIQLEHWEGKSIFDLYPDLKGSRIDEALESAIKFSLPSSISNVFNPTPFPLYNPGNFAFDELSDNRIQQSINISHINQDNGDHFCLIQINDVTASVAREKHLELQVKERKEIELSMLEIETKQRTIMETMIDALIIFNSNGFIESVNPAAEQIFSLSEVEITGNSIAKFIVEFNPIKTNKSPYELMLALDIIGKTKECKAIKPNGDYFPIDLSISEIQLDDEVLFSAVIRDISDRKQVEKLKQEFVTTVSHELRTPLTSIRGALGLLCGGIIQDIPDKATELIHVAKNNCDRLMLLINDILDIEKANSGNMSFDFKKHHLTTLINRSIENNIAYAAQYKVTYQLMETAHDLHINVDEHRFQQIMSNLLSNAAKFSPENGIVEINVQGVDNHVEIDVKDFGRGIPDKFKLTIWNKFTQADTSTTREKGGTGLGLAISKTLIEAMDGKISFESQENQGSTFKLTFPIVS